MENGGPREKRVETSTVSEDFGSLYESRRSEIVDAEGMCRHGVRLLLTLRNDQFPVDGDPCRGSLTLYWEGTLMVAWRRKPNGVGHPSRRLA